MSVSLMCVTAQNSAGVKWHKYARFLKIPEIKISSCKFEQVTMKIEYGEEIMNAG
jgi:hypothetical protein